MAILLELPSETEALLREQASSSGKDIGQYIASLIRPRKSTMPSLSKRETELFSVINRGFDEPYWKRLWHLDALRVANKLTDDEHMELVAMAEQVEETNADRMVALVELAQLRGVHIDDLMKKLGISHGRHS